MVRSTGIKESIKVGAVRQKDSLELVLIPLMWQLLFRVATKSWYSLLFHNGLVLFHDHLRIIQVIHRYVSRHFLLREQLLHSKLAS